MAGFRLIDRFIPSDGINVQTRKVFVDSATSNIAIGDIVSYTGGFDPGDPAIRFVDRAISTDSSTNPGNIAGIVIGFTSLDTILSNQSGLLTNESGFVLVNTGLNLVYGATLTGTFTGGITNPVGANIGFTVAASGTTSGIITSGMQFDATSANETPGTVRPFRIEWLNNATAANATIAYGRLQISELNSLDALV